MEGREEAKYKEVQVHTFKKRQQKVSLKAFQNSQENNPNIKGFTGERDLSKGFKETLDNFPGHILALNICHFLLSILSTALAVML